MNSNARSQKMFNGQGGRFSGMVMIFVLGALVSVQAKAVTSQPVGIRQPTSAVTAKPHHSSNLSHHARASETSSKIEGDGQYRGLTEPMVTEMVGHLQLQDSAAKSVLRFVHSAFAKHSKLPSAIIYGKQASFGFVVKVGGGSGTESGIFTTNGYMRNTKIAWGELGGSFGVSISGGTFFMMVYGAQSPRDIATTFANAGGEFDHFLGVA